MKSLVTCLISLAIFCSHGCIHNCYVVEITPHGDSFDRTLTCWREGGGDPPDVSPLSEEDLERIGKLYETRTTTEGGKKHVFSGRFQGDTPADVGGAGSCTHLVTSLGTLSAYVERFRGPDDLQAELAQRHAAADRLTELVIGWLETELGDEPGFVQLKRFLDEDFRTDLKNLALFAWAATAVAEHEVDVEEEYSIRLAQYMVERDYLTFGELPGIVRAFSDEDPKHATKWIQRLVARKMGTQEERLPFSMSFLGDQERLEESLASYIRTTEEYKKRLKDWQEQQASDPESEAHPPEPMDLVTELALGGLLSFDLGPADSLEVKLHAKTEPFVSNGEWDADSASVAWTETLDSQRGLPLVCYAVWSCPEEKAQSRHFGKVALQGKELAEYVVWYLGLAPEEVSEWDEFIESCKPDENLRTGLESFRFGTDPQPSPDAAEEEKPRSLADKAKGLILKGLEDTENEGSGAR